LDGGAELDQCTQFTGQLYEFYSHQIILGNRQDWLKRFFVRQHVLLEMLSAKNINLSAIWSALY